MHEPVIAAYGESKSNTEVFRLLAQAMGFDEQALKDDDKELINQALSDLSNPYLPDLSYDQLKDVRYMKASNLGDYLNNLQTPSGKIELYSKKMEVDGYPALPTYIPLVQEKDYPLQFVPAPNHNFLNSTFSNNEKHIKLEKAPKLFMNQQDAESRGHRRWCGCSYME